MLDDDHDLRLLDPAFPADLLAWCIMARFFIRARMAQKVPPFPPRFFGRVGYGGVGRNLTVELTAVLQECECEEAPRRDCSRREQPLDGLEQGGRSKRLS